MVIEKSKVKFLCRVCLSIPQQDPSLLQSHCIFDANKTYANIIAKCLAVQLTSSSSFPQNICWKCITQLQTCYEFYTKCVNSETTLRQLLSHSDSNQLASGATTNKQPTLDAILGAIKTEEGLVTTIKRETEDIDHLNDVLDGSGIETTLNTSCTPEIKVGKSLVANIKNAKIECRDGDFSDSSSSEKDKDSDWDNLRQIVSCGVCFKQFSSRSSFKRHANIFHPQLNSNLIIIVSSGSKSDNSDARLRHSAKSLKNEDTNSNSGDQRPALICTMCSRRYSSRISFRYHAKINHPSVDPNIIMMEDYDSQSDHSKDRSITDYKRQKMEQPSHTRFCPMCSWDHEFTLRQTWRKHIIDHHHLYPCYHCTETFKTKVEAASHRMVVHKGCKYSCPYCPFKLKTRATLIEHCRNMHSINFDSKEIPDTMSDVEVSFEKSVSKSKRKRARLLIGKSSEKKASKSTQQEISKKTSYQCVLCSYQCSSHEDLRQHKTQHLDANGLLTCPHCEHKHSRYVHMQNHIRYKHSNIPSREFICTHCGKRLNGPTSWKQHIQRIHVKEKKFACDHCPQKFFFAHELKHHTKRVHTDEKDYICDICSKCFATPVQLRRHRHQHNPPDKYKCDKCPKAFGINESLLKHKKTHAESNLPCEFCDKVFSMPKYLQRHMYTHTGEKPVKCKICGAGFNQHTSLYLHIKKHHSRMSNTLLAPETKSAEKGCKDAF